MAETSIHPVLYPQWSNQTEFRWNKFNKIKDNFLVEVVQRQAMNKGFRKCIAVVDYFDKALIDSYAINGEISTGIVKRLLKTTENNNKHNKIIMPARIKLNSVETWISKVLTDSKEDIKIKKSLKCDSEEKDDWKKLKELGWVTLLGRVVVIYKNASKLC